MDDFSVYVISSSKCLEDIKNLLSDSGDYKYAGIIYKRVKRNINGTLYTIKEETKKTIVFCKSSTIERLNTVIKDTSLDMSVADYNWATFRMPELESENWNLYVNGFPRGWSVQKTESFIIDTLSILLDKSEYTISLPVKSRETGEIYGFGTIYFKDTVDKQLVKLCKLVLHNTATKSTLMEDQRALTCVWYRFADVAMRSALEKNNNRYTKPFYHTMWTPMRMLQRH